MALPIPCTPSHVSVNRVRIIDLPGLPIDDQVRGRLAHELLSTRAILRYAQARAEALRLPPALTQNSRRTRAELPRHLNRCLNGPDERVRAAARAIGRRLGRNLGHLLLALRRADAVNRNARADWTDADWARWEAIRQVRLGGGLLSGRLGGLILGHARAFLAEVGSRGRPHLKLASHPAALPLLGAGRYLPAATRHALCLDFGHTLVKRACLGYEDGTLAHLACYAASPTALDWLDGPRDPNPDTGRQVLRFMTEAIVRTLADCRADGHTPGPTVMLSVAAYVRGGHLLGNGLYANLSTLADDARPLLAESLQARTGRAMRVDLIHDGTAAGAVYAGEPDSAVLLAGTALGIGFPPADARGLRPLASELMLEDKDR